MPTSAAMIAAVLLLVPAMLPLTAAERSPEPISPIAVVATLPTVAFTSARAKVTEPSVPPRLLVIFCTAMVPPMPPFDSAIASAEVDEPVAAIETRS